MGNINNIFKAAILLVFLASQTYKAQETSVEVEIISFEELMALTSSVASKSEEGVLDAPSSVMVFTHKEIETMGISSLEELLNYVPGFQTSRDIEQGTANRISARGRSTALSESILFLVNGQRMNDLYTGGISIINRLIPVENIKQVEIIRGPGSALYGSNAFLGVVDIITFDNANSAHFKLGSDNEREIAVNFAKLSGDFKISGFFKGFSSEGYEYKDVTDVFGKTGETTDPIKGIDAFLTLEYKSLTVHARHMERSLQNFLTFGALANNVNNENTKQYSVDANFKTQLSDKFDLEFTAGYSQDEWKSQALLIPAGLEIAPDFSLSSNFNGGPYLKSYNLNVNVDAFFRIAESNELIAGLSTVRSAISDVMNLMNYNPISLEYQGEIAEFEDDSNNFNKKETRNIFGFYLQDKQTIGDNISLTAGIRYDNYNDFGSSFNPRFAFIYSTPIDSKIKFMFGKAFRAPNFLELYDKNNPVDFGNSKLEAEKVQTFEVAYVQKLSNLAATITYFNNTISDQIVLGAPIASEFNPLGAPSFVNGADLETKGLEIDFKYSPLDNILVAGTLTKLFDADNLQMPSTFASLIFNYNKNNFNININGIYRDKINLMPSQDAYFVFNTAITYSITNTIKTQLKVANLFDEEYSTFSLVFPKGVINPGRTFTIGAIIDF